VEGGIAPHTYCLPNLVTMHEEFEDTKRVIRIRKSKKDRQHNSQKKKAKRSNKDIQIKVITKLPNSEQSYKGKVKTHNYINRQNQSTTGTL
jgi:hypothetical protein